MTAPMKDTNIQLDNDTLSKEQQIEKYGLEINKVYNEDCMIGMSKIKDKSIDMILCDLPYGTTQNKWDSVIPLDNLWKEYKRIIKDRGAIVLTSSQPFTSILISSNLKMFKYTWTWDKSQITGFLNSKRQPLRKTEDICVFYKKQCTYHPQMTKGKAYKINRTHGTDNYGKQVANSTVNDGERFPTNILNIPQVRVKNGHPTQKPVELGEYLINTYTDDNEIVLDNTCGSGSFLVAAKKTNRSYIGFENDTEFGYFKMATERLD